MDVIKEEFIVAGASKRSMLIDATFCSTNNNKPVVIFSHGFKGFKDWGPFNQISEYFAREGFCFIKFNFSHNGTSVSDPINFVDLKAFGNNNFCKELEDLSLVIDWVINSNDLKLDINVKNISLLGHSRGGAISVLKSAEENRINKIISWASPSDLLARLPVGKKLKLWKNKGVAYIFNSRTQQNMPMYYQFYENCIDNINRLDIKKVVCNIQIPLLVLHGSADMTVLVDHAKEIKRWGNENVHLNIIKGTDHVFNAYHPYDSIDLPVNFLEVVDRTIAFLKE